MDYRRKIGKSDEPKKWVKQPTPFVSVSDGLINPDVTYPEDHRLINWKTWLKRRKKQYEHIKSTTGRHQNDQILNSCEKVRAQAEMRNLIDYASVPVPIIPDKYRGGPEFWRTPKPLSKDDTSCLSEVTVTPNKKELNIIPELTYVGLPELIEKEKDLHGLHFKVPLWKRSQYLMKRRKELSKEIRTLVPKEPEMKDLIIKNYTAPKKEMLKRIPPITVCGVENETEEDSCHKAYSEQVVVLKIQNHEIVWEKSAVEGDHDNTEPITWNLRFSGEVNKITENEIVFENKGNRVIIYHWRETMFRSSHIPLTRRISPFFFNKTKGVIPPGQIVKLPIWYKPRSSGVSIEFWKLLTNPILCSSPLVFRLWGCAVATAKSNRADLIDRYLDHCIRETVIREIIDDIMDKLDTFEYPKPAYGSLFLESELFLEKNPLCFYNPSISMEFHQIYRIVTNQEEHRWNMSIRDLREILLESGEHRNMLLPLSELYKECLKPTFYRPIQYNKHEVVYNLLCSFFNLFEVESEFARDACFVKESRDSSSGMSLEENSAVSTSVSQEFENNIVRNKRTSSSYSRFENNQVREITKTSVSVIDDQPYKEIFFLRIYALLGETVTRVFATIESFNNLSEPDK
ncbi:MYCBP-associated protein [Anthophora quadrimaculata]